jgi:hypothetical protein
MPEPETPETNTDKPGSASALTDETTWSRFGPCEKDPSGSPKIKQVNGYWNRHGQQTKQKGRIEKIHSGFFGKQDFLINERLSAFRFFSP